MAIEIMDFPIFPLKMVDLSIATVKLREGTLRRMDGMKMLGNSAGNV